MGDAIYNITKMGHFVIIISLNMEKSCNFLQKQYNLSTFVV